MLEIFKTLPEDKKIEVFDFVNFLKHRTVKKRILESNKEPRVTFHNTDELMSAIDNAD